jgi:localization factor PodJL
MAKEALNTQDTGSWQHAETRAAILAVARGLLAEGGVPNLSLDAVAAGAGFAQATIYAYFASRQDLLVSILCDDLAIFARGLRDEFPFSEPEEPVAEDVAPVLALVPPAQEHVEVPVVIAPTDEPVVPQDNDAPVEEPQPVMEEPVAEEPAAEEIAPFEPAAAEIPVEPAFAGEGGEIAELKQAVAKLEARKVDAWLERRLRMFEKTLADVETRLAAAETTVTRASGVVEENLKALGQSSEALDKRQREASDGLAERLEGADRKARGTLAELRAALNDVYGRLETLEIAKGIAVTPSPPLDTQWEAGEVTVAPHAPAREDKPLTAAAETYLSAARRAAKTASELAEIERTNGFLAAARKSWTRTHLILTACVALGVMLVVAGLVMRQSMSAPVVHRTIVAPVPRAVVTQIPAAVKPVQAAIAAPAKPDMAVYRLSALASTGNADAELLLALRKMDGTGVAKSDAEAAQLLQHAAEQGNPVAQYWLGTLYQRGRGVSANPATAWRWYAAAAKKGNVKAMYNLADADAQGRGTKADTAQAAHWFWVAAMQGYVDAQYNLAVLYERGQGVPQSLVNAYKWYAIAAAAGDKDSKASIDVLKTQLKPAELAAGEHAAAGYVAIPTDQAANAPPNG